MRRSFIIAWALLLAGFACLGQASAFWQSRDSNYNIEIAAAGGYQGPGDVYSTSVFGWYGIRAYSLATAGNKSVNACNPANTCADISTNTAGNLSFSGSIGGSACSVSISSGTYVTATGALVLTTSAGVTSFASGSNFALSGLTGTGSFSSINGVWRATAGTTGTTVDATVTTGLGTVTITGGTVSVCPVATAYEQSGGGAPNLTQATVANQPLLVINCDGAISCLGFNRTLALVLTGTITAYSQVTTSFSGVAERIQNTSNFGGIIGNNGTSAGLTFFNSANEISAQFGSASQNVALTPVNDSAWHAMQGVSATGTCNIYADGSSNSNASCLEGTSGTTLQIGLFTSATQYLSGYIAEAGLWKSSMSGANAGNVCHNQYLYYSIAGATC